MDLMTLTASARRAQEAERAAVTAQLWQEFERLNAEFFAGKLTLREIRVSTRKQYGGYYQKSNSLIVLSWLSYQTHGWDETLNTFRHEVAHIVHQDHSRAFWDLAYRLGCTRRYALPPTEPNPAYAQFVYECPNCKTQIRRRKKIALSSCGACDRKFNPAFRWRLVSSPTIRAKSDADDARIGAKRNK